MKTVRATLDAADTSSLSVGRIDPVHVDATSEEDLARQGCRADEAEAMQGVVRFARRVRRRLGLSQAAFALRIDAPLETIE